MLVAIVCFFVVFLFYVCVYRLYFLFICIIFPFHCSGRIRPSFYSVRGGDEIENLKLIDGSHGIAD